MPDMFSSVRTMPCMETSFLVQVGLCDFQGMGGKRSERSQCIKDRHQKESRKLHKKKTSTLGIDYVKVTNQHSKSCRAHGQ